MKDEIKKLDAAARKLITLAKRANERYQFRAATRYMDRAEEKIVKKLELQKALHNQRRFPN